jgi:hypothetical protein
MHFISETVSDGVSEQLFTLGDIPGVLWTPAEARIQKSVWSGRSERPRT